jgi:hypothetical protein
MIALSYTTSNLGDDIQTLAAIQHFKHDEPVKFVNRDMLAKYRGPDDRVILNGWWAHETAAAWPPPKQLKCLPTSMHIQAKSRPHFSCEYSRRWMADHGPIGARDTETFQWLMDHEINAYHSACMTLTFPNPGYDLRERSGIIFCDLTPAIENMAGIKPTLKTTHKVIGAAKSSVKERHRLANELLYQYSSARLVVTTRLHAALPCAAMGTPVICIGEGPRYSGMGAFITMVPKSDLPALAGVVKQAMDAPADKSAMVRNYAADLTHAARRFTGAIE